MDSRGCFGAAAAAVVGSKVGLLNTSMRRYVSLAAGVHNSWSRKLLIRLMLDSQER